MKAIFIGRARPYERKAERGGGMAYAAWFAFPDADGDSIQDPIRIGSNALLDEKLRGVECGLVLDIEVNPRMFAGKVQGFDLVGISG